MTHWMLSGRPRLLLDEVEKLSTYYQMRIRIIWMSRIIGLSRVRKLR